MEERLQSHYESLSRVIRFTRTADMKAAPVLALQLALTGALASRVDQLVPIVATGPCDAERIALVVVGVVYLLCLAGAIWAAATVYVPRSPKTGQSFIFFEDIAAMEYSVFESKARNMNSVLIEQQLIGQIYRVSGVASIKMKRVRHAIWWSAPAVILGLGLLVWSSV